MQFGSSVLSSLVDLAASDIVVAATDNIEAERKATYFIFWDMPRGKHNPEFGLDGMEYIIAQDSEDDGNFDNKAWMLSRIDRKEDAVAPL